MQELFFKPIRYVRTEVSPVTRHGSISEVVQEIIIDCNYQEGLRDIHKGEKIVVIFCFRQSTPFSPDKLIQKPPHREEELGVFSICSPVRPNP
ncbi:MAG: TrmO family methyltransferase, partial [Desulfobacterota bacterium]|nr:TrmO family methyltransferase [Thermodesulfobacteriota bacterium]